MQTWGISPNDKSRGPCICFLSAYSNIEYIKRARSVGIKHYLFKPVSGNDVNIILRQTGFIESTIVKSEGTD